MNQCLCLENKQNELVPSKVLYSIASTLAPWQVLGVIIPGLSILYLSFLAIVLDFRFWMNFITKFELEKKSLIWLMSLMSLALYASFISEKSESVIVNFAMPALYTLYMYFGIKEHGVYWFGFGIISAVMFSMMQFVEVNVFQTRNFSVDNFKLKVFGGIWFGVSQPIGSVASLEFLKDYFRVSGPTAEPGLFAQALLVSLPIFKNKKKVIFFIILGLVFSFSKITIMLLIAGLCLLAFLRLKVGSFAFLLLVISFFYLTSAVVLDNKFENKANFLKFNPSIYMRLLPALIYKELPIEKKILGVGKYGACKEVDVLWHMSTETKSGYIDFEKQENCFMTNFSGLGSLWVDFGAIGVILFGLLFTYTPNAKTKFDLKSILINKKSIIFFWWFVCFLNVYILTFVPSSYYFLAWVFTLSEE